LANNDRKIFTLSVVLNRIKEIFDEKIHGKFLWLKVEIANINFHNSGHCYLELAETNNGVNIATCKAAIWRGSLVEIEQDLGKEFRNVLKKGNEILCNVELQFSVKYGLSIHIKRIDLEFNLGALERKKQETLDRLAKEEIIDKNKQVKLPIVIQKIAIVGSPQTSGFQDLIKQLNENSYQYYFDIEIFSTLVQGEQAEAEIVSRLRELQNSRFEAIALVRGGGSKLDLEVFNSYNLTKEIALHDKPILTGIGHETDVSVADVVANVHLKTPTALGSFIVQKARDFEVRYTTTNTAIVELKDRYLQELKSKLKLAVQDIEATSISYTQLRRGKLHQQLNRIFATTSQRISEENRSISLSIQTIQSNTANLIEGEKRELLQTMELIRLDSTTMINMGLDHFKNTMELIATRAQNLIRENESYYRNILDMVDVYKPDEVMKKGYAIPRFKGELLRDQILNRGDEIEIELYNRILTVVLHNTKKKWLKNSITKMLQKN
jgi:exodeoxyribonuclease VII large subunit